MSTTKAETWNARVAKILEHFQRSPLWRQAEADYREHEESARAEDARELARTKAARDKRAADLLRVRDRAAERVAKAEAELAAARDDLRAGEWAFSELNGADLRIQELEHNLRATASPSIGETRARLRELFDGLPGLLRFETFDARATVGENLTWRNLEGIEAAQETIRRGLADLRELELETLSESALQARLAEVMDEAKGAVSRIPRAPAEDWADRRAADLSRELATARAERFKEDTAEKIRAREVIEQNRRRSRGVALDA